MIFAALVLAPALLEDFSARGFAEALMLKEHRIRGRVVEIDLAETAGLGWLAVGIVRQGLGHEEGKVFEAKGKDAGEAETRLVAEIEAFFG